jgi:hypothetical protein
MRLVDSRQVEEVMTKRVVIAILLAFPLLMAAQRSHMQSGHTGMAGSGQFGAGRIAGTNPAYNPRTFSNFYGSNFYGSGYNTSGYFYGPRNGTILGPGFNNGSAPSNIVTFVADSAPAVQGQYIPTYMRQDDGPSLAEIAKSLRTEHKPAVLIWRNWESPATPVKN